MDSLENWNKLTTSEQIAMIGYWYALEREMEKPGMINFISTLQDRATVYDVPDVVAKGMNK